MTISGYPGITNVPPTAISGGVSVGNCVLIAAVGDGASEAARPRRRSAASAKREAEDPAYRDRKRTARAALVTEMSAGRGPTTLAEVRMAKGLSQHDLAALTGLTQPHIAKIEARKLAIQLATAWKIAAALSISIDDLVPLVLPLESVGGQIKAITEPQ